MGLAVSSTPRRHSVLMDVSVMCGRAAAGGTVGGELAIGRGSSRHELVCGGSGETRTMVRPGASAAKLRGGGPIPHRGRRAMLALGSPPPRTVIGRPPRGRGRAPNLLARDPV